ncbi:MAG: glycerophosphodiester phosphodiesterase family protein [Erythrobacter sp.]|uniref:glycerophosphodiester phosphodiesterase family protein n=1 Tax=Erythrobacter sp. TaxID=1042 RepID=UPI0032EB800C
MTVRAAPEWLTACEYAHRGLHSPGVPENSLAAAEAAIAAGMGIECDIQRSRDNHPIVFHDWELTRLTGQGGTTEDLTADELETLRLLGTDQTPLRLDRFLEAVGGRTTILIEIKSKRDYDIGSTCLSVARLLEAHASTVAVMSFDQEVPKWFSRHSPLIPCGLVCTDTLDNGFKGVWRERDPGENGAADFLALDIRDLPDPQAAAWRADHGPLLTWTVRTAELRQKALLQADALISEGNGLP